MNEPISSESEHLLTRYVFLLGSVAFPAGLVHLSEKQAREQVQRSILMSELIAQQMSGAFENPRQVLTKGQASAHHRLLIDVGSGAGLPAIPMAIALSERARTEGGPALESVLVEPKRRAVAFLEKVVRDLDLKITVFHGSAQQAAADGFDGKGAFVTAKALAEAKLALQLCAPLCETGGKIILTAKSEIESPTKDLESSAGGIKGMGIKSMGIASTELITLSGGNHLTQRVLLATKS